MHSDRHLLYADWSRRDSTLVTRDSFFTDLRQNARALSAFHVGLSDARIFLPPYEWYNREISSWCADSGLVLINFTPGTFSNADYTTPDMGPRYLSSDTILAKIFAYERQDPSGLNGFILLIHAGSHPSRTDKFTDRLDQLITTLEQRGYSFARIDELPGLREHVTPH